MPKLGRRIHWLGKKELFDWPIVGWAAANGGVHPVDRGAADVEAFRLAKRILDEGHILFVFPEGTRSPDGALQEAQDGVAVLAMRTGAPIVPIGDRRLERRLAEGPEAAASRRPRHGPRRRAVPARRVLPAGHGPANRQGPRRRRMIMERIAALLPPSQRGVYGASRLDRGVPDGSTDPVR